MKLDMTFLHVHVAHLRMGRGYQRLIAFHIAREDDDIYMDDEESEESIGCAKCYVPPSLYFLFGLRYPQKENPIEPMFRQHSICSASSWVQPSG